ncbi:MAG: hypothetical protein ABEJ61_08965 [Haloferacaceae archaeon]
MRLGILETVGLAASLVFAIPVGVAALQFLLGDRPALGAVLALVAVLMVVVPRRVTTPGDVPGAVAERAASAALGDEGAGDEHEDAER